MIVYMQKGILVGTKARKDALDIVGGRSRSVMILGAFWILEKRRIKLGVTR